MGEPRADTAATLSLPSRAAIGEALLADEDQLITALIEQARLSEAQRQRVTAVATRLVEAARAGRRESGGVDSFLAEYGLSSEEGVLLLCLAEALLRIPDAATADRLIAAFLADRIGAEFPARVSGLVRTGLFVRLAETGADGFVPASGIGHEYFYHDEVRRALVGEDTGLAYQLGDPVEVRLVEAIPTAGALRFDMLSEGRQIGTKQGRKRPPAKGRAGKPRSKAPRGKSRSSKSRGGKKRR